MLIGNDCVMQKVIGYLIILLAVRLDGFLQFHLFRVEYGHVFEMDVQFSWMRRNDRMK